MSAITYQNLTLGWEPESKLDRQYNIIVAIVLSVVLLIGAVLSSIDLPVQERQTRAAVPERIAKFILEKEKKQIVKPEPIPEPKPVPVKPRITKVKEKVEKPLTKTQAKAREKVKDTGLLALGDELADLIDTSDVSAMVGGKVKKGAAASSAAENTSQSLLTADAAAGSGGVSGEHYTASVSRTQLSQREITQVRQSLGSGSVNTDKSSKTSRSRGGNVRAEEDITIVFDQNKGKLYSIYNRARRSNPGLKGKIVLEISIASDGTVTQVNVISSELNDPKLEQQLVSRVRQFKFEASGVEPIVVTYPIEFLPS